jgi:hypothetical protein
MKLRSFLRKFLIALAIVFILIQFVRPAKNTSGVATHPMSAKYHMPTDVETIFENACYNCHSNKTNYPWYAEVQPVAWWLANHVKEGKQHLNFDEFTGRRIAFQNHKLEEIGEEVKEKEMPLPSYTWLGLHQEADLTDEQRQMIIDWAAAQMDTLKNQYPADSLKMPKRQGPPPGK